MARALIVGCGCRGRKLGGVLLDRGWQVRGTSRDRQSLEEIGAAGIEAAIADPDQPGTVLELCGDAAVVVWLLGSSVGDSRDLAALHGARLERLLEKLVDSPVRGFVYEAAGSAPSELLAGGKEIVERAARTWRIPVAVLELDPEGPGWARSAADEVDGVLGR